MREANDSPLNVISGKPIRIASLAMVPALYGNVSRNISGKASRAMYSAGSTRSANRMRAGSTPARLARVRKLLRDQALSEASQSTDPGTRCRIAIQAPNIVSVIL